MINTFKVGQYIKSRLDTIGNVETYPVIATEGAKDPYIVYQRTGLEESRTKDGQVYDEVQYDILVASQSYKRSVELIQQVREKLRPCKLEDFRISDVKTVDSKEGYDDNYYLQNIIMIFRVER